MGRGVGAALTNLNLVNTGVERGIITQQGFIYRDFDPRGAGGGGKISISVKEGGKLYPCAYLVQERGGGGGGG